MAAECGLSVSAVSQVLNGKEIGIPQKTKEKVRAAAEKLRYRPNSAARSLVTSRSDTVGVLVPDISNAFFGESFKEIQRRMGEEGFDVLLCSGDGTAKQDERFLRLFAARGADGLIVAPAAETLDEKNAEKFAALLEEIRIPYVYLDRYPAQPCARVSADHRAGGYAAAQCLLKNGHTKIGCIAGACGARRRAAAAGRLLRRARGSGDKTARDKRAIYGGRGRTRGESAVRQGPDRAVRLR